MKKKDDNNLRPMLPPSPRSGVSLPADALWKPGQSGNPGGAPAGTRVSTWLARYGDMTPEDWPVKGSPAWKRLPCNARVALAQLSKAIMDDLDAASASLAAAAWTTDRVEGGVDRTVHLTHKQEPSMTPEQVAMELRNAGLTGPDDPAKLEHF